MLRGRTEQLFLLPGEYFMTVMARAAYAALLVVSAASGEPITYSYDALGRLIKVERPGSAATVRSEYTYDAAGNRTHVLVTDAAPPPPLPTPPSFTIGNASGSEDDYLQFTVTRSSLDANSYTVNYATQAVTALSPSDFTAVSGTLTFGPNEASKIIQVYAVDDAVAENDEVFYVNLSSPSGGATLANTRGTGTIYDDDAGTVGGGCKLMQEVRSNGEPQAQMLPPPGC